MRQKNGKNVECAFCKKEFYVNPGRLKNRYHCCSRECSAKVSSQINSKKIKASCEICNKEIFYKKHRFGEIKHHTCSVECRAILMSSIYKGRGNPKALGLNELERFFWERAATLKRRAEIKGLEFGLTYVDLCELYQKQVGLCHYTRLPMKISGGKSFDTLSVDRLDSKKGYTKDNVVLALLSVNMFKSNYSLDEMRDVFRSLELGYSYSVEIKTKKLFPDAQIPSKKDKSDAGYDIFVHRTEDCGDFIKVYSGIAIQPEVGYYVEKVARSSTYKKGLILYNSIGVIDNTYTGELVSIFYKTSSFKELPQKGDRLCQLLIRKQITADFQVVEDLSDTNRGSGGFGSTGK